MCFWKVKMVDVTGRRMEVELYSVLTATRGGKK
jgi:hypothetical protein